MSKRDEFRVLARHLVARFDIKIDFYIALSECLGFRFQVPGFVVDIVEGQEGGKLSPTFFLEEGFKSKHWCTTHLGSLLEQGSTAFGAGKETLGPSFEGSSRIFFNSEEILAKFALDRLAEKGM